MIHMGKAIAHMVRISGTAQRRIAWAAGYSEQEYYRIIKKKHINTKVLEDFSRVCKKKVKIVID
jgi:hypothetical protein